LSVKKVFVYLSWF